MTDEEIYQLIEDNKEETEAFYQKIHTQVEASIVKHAEIKKRRKKNMRIVFSTATAFILILCLAVVLPIVLQTEKGPFVQFYDDLDLMYENIELSMFEYYRNIDETVLCLDWYETAEECITTRYYEKNDIDTTVYLKEFFVHEEGYFAEFAIMKKNIAVKSYETEWEKGVEKQINGINVTYVAYPMRSIAKAKFEYKGYKYYIKLLDSADEDFLLSTIENLIPQQ